MATNNKNGEVQCLQCLEERKLMYFHRLDVHLSKHGMTVKQYNEKFPGSETISETAKFNASRGQRGKAVDVDKMRRLRQPVAAKAAKTAEPSTLQEFQFKCGVKLSMRDLDTLSDYDKTFVPKYDEDWQISEVEAEKWEMLALAIATSENVLDVGPTGCGKTASILQLAAVLNQPVRRINLDGDIRAADFIGANTISVDPASGQSVIAWVDGLFTEAWRKGYWIVLDEIDAGQPGILFAIQAALEQNGHLVIKATGEVVPKHSNTRIFATANTLGRGDDTGMYTGTNVLNEAFLDRFGIVLESDYPAESNEVRILVTKGGVDEATALKMRTVAAKVREAFKQENCYCTFSTRRLIAWAQKTKMLSDARKASSITVLNKLSRDDRKFVGDLIQRYFGGTIVS